MLIKSIRQYLYCRVSELMLAYIPHLGHTRWHVTPSWQYVLGMLRSM